MDLKIKIKSLKRNVLIKMQVLICMFVLIQLLNSCYSFTGGSVPTHLKTLGLASINDKSGFGNPDYKVLLSESLIVNFRRDGSFELVETGGDARLNVAISSITEATQSVNPGELETERRVTVVCTVEYYDFINKKVVWKRDFSNYGIFEIKNSQASRNEAIKNALTQIADDILLAVVSGW